MFLILLVLSFISWNCFCENEFNHSQWVTYLLYNSRPKKSWKKDTAITKDVLHALIVTDLNWINYKSMLDSITKSIARHVILKYGTPLCLWNHDQKSKLNQETILVAQGVMEKFLKVVIHRMDFYGSIF